MASKNKVNVTVKGKGNTTVSIGGTLGHPASSSSENDVRVNVGGENLATTAVGGNVATSALSELHNLLILSLKDKNEQDDVEKIAAQLEEQAILPVEERNQSKAKMLLDDLISYVSVASLAVAQAEKIKTLYDQVLKFFGF